MRKNKKKNRTLLYTLAVTILAASTATLAAETGGDAKRQEMFANVKAIKVEGIQKRISILQTALSCVQSASTHDAVEACSKTERTSNEELMHAQKEKWEALKNKH